MLALCFENSGCPIRLSTAVNNKLLVPLTFVRKSCIVSWLGWGMISCGLCTCVGPRDGARRHAVSDTDGRRNRGARPMDVRDLVSVGQAKIKISHRVGGFILMSDYIPRSSPFAAGA